MRGSFPELKWEEPYDAIRRPEALPCAGLSGDTDRPMDRRLFTQALGIATAGLMTSRTAKPFLAEAPQIAITIDDFNFFGASQTVAEQRNRRLLSALRAHKGLT